MMMVATKKLMMTKGHEKEDDDKPVLGEGCALLTMWTRGNGHHCSIAICLNIINDVFSINASFIFQYNLINTIHQPSFEPTVRHHDTVVKTTNSIVEKVPSATPTPQTSSTTCW